MTTEPTTTHSPESPHGEGQATAAQVRDAALPEDSNAPAAAAPCPAVDPAPHAAPLMLHMPVDVRNLSLALLALFASVALLHWASAVSYTHLTLPTTPYV